MRTLASSKMVLALSLLAITAPNGIALAQDGGPGEMPLEIEVPEDPMQVLLGKQKGKKVGIVLESGSEIGGTVADVTFDSVTLREVTGKEMFDATIRIDQVAAVLQRRDAAPAAK